MPPINFITSVMVIVGFAVVARAYMPLLRGLQFKDFNSLVVRGVVIVAIVSVARSGYWDGVQFFAGDHWPAIASFFGGQKISTIFNLFMLWAIYEFLAARVYLIPSDDRHRWRWWSAWSHPGDNCVIDWRVREKE